MGKQCIGRTLCTFHVSFMKVQGGAIITKRLDQDGMNFWGELDGFTAHGMSAKEACCGCGGGNKNPDDSEPLYNGVPSYPYAEVYELIVHIILHTP